MGAKGSMRIFYSGLRRPCEVRWARAARVRQVMGSFIDVQQSSTMFKRLMRLLGKCV